MCGTIKRTVGKHDAAGKVISRGLEKWVIRRNDESGIHSIEIKLLMSFKDAEKIKVMKML